MKNNRTKNVFRNVSWAFLLQIILMLLQFVVRTVFIKQLGRNYLGITGLLSDIMLILDLANLRIPEAVILSMYKPLAENDENKIIALLNFLRKAFYIISFSIMCLGLIVMFFLPFIMKDPPKIPENFYILYLFYLLQLVFSYLLIYKRFIIYADQKNFIFSIYNNVFHFIQIILQIIILFTIKNFYAFVGIQFIIVILTNFTVSKKAEKMYPFIKENNKYKLNKIEIKEIIVNIKSMFIYGLGSVTLNSIDSILVSSIIGISTLGLCSNYMLIVSSVNSLVDQAMSGFTASIGNLNAKEDPNTIENIFYEVYFIVFAISSFFSINLAISLNSLISVWLDNSFLLSQSIIISLVLRFYVQSTQYITFTFRSTLGLIKKIRYIPIITSLSNIILAIIMGHLIGVAGIFFASSISIFLFTLIPESLLLYKNIFKKSSYTYFLYYFKYLFYIVFNYFIITKLLNFFEFSGWTGFLLRSFLGACISIILFTIIFFKNKYFRSLFSRIIYSIFN